MEKAIPESLQGRHGVATNSTNKLRFEHELFLGTPCRPFGTHGDLLLTSPGTDVPGYHMPPLSRLEFCWNPRPPRVLADCKKTGILLPRNKNPRPVSPKN